MPSPDSNALLPSLISLLVWCNKWLWIFSNMFAFSLWFRILISLQILPSSLCIMHINRSPNLVWILICYMWSVCFFLGTRPAIFLLEKVSLDFLTITSYVEKIGRELSWTWKIFDLIALLSLEFNFIFETQYLFIHVNCPSSEKNRYSDYLIYLVP